MIEKHIQSFLVFSLALSVPLAPIAMAAQPPSAEASAPLRVYIETDTKALGERGLGMQAAVIRELRVAFEAEGVEILEPEDDDPDAVRLRIRFSGDAEEVAVYDYELHFELVEGKTATQLIEPVACSRCVDAVLHKKLNEQVSPLVEAIKAETAVANDTEGSDVTPPPGDGDGDGDTDPPVGAKPKPIGPVGISGAVVLAIGVGLSVGGGIVLADPKQLNIGEAAQFGIERDRTPLGIGLLVPGATFVVAGAIMLAVDVSKRAKQRKRAESITVIPTLSPTSAGLGVVGRF